MRPSTRRSDRQQGNAAEARRHLEVAVRLVRHVGGDRDLLGTEFGPTDVALHQVAVAVELGNAAEALELAATIDASGLSREPEAPS